ncbi:hypothetical protein HY404_01400 [Candidatus Microgenomates bacterium]|nr:hypothetical protein [Candidatus Microgenomates bacterium]
MLNQHLTTALVHIRRSPYQAVAAILILVLTFFVATIFAALTYVSTITLHYFETKPQIIAFLKDTAKPEQISALSRKLASDSRIRSNIKFVSHEEAFKIFKGIMEDNPLATELVSPDVLPTSLEFSVTDLSFAQEVIDEVKKDNIVKSVEFTASVGGKEQLSQIIEKLQQVTKYIRVAGITLLTFLGLVSIFILLLIIGMRVASRREEIEVLTLIGATPGFIRTPFLLEGILYAVIGALIGFLLALVLLLYLAPNLSIYFGEIPVLPQDTATLITKSAVLIGAELAAAMLIGIMGAWFAIARYLKL